MSRRVTRPVSRRVTRQPAVRPSAIRPPLYARVLRLRHLQPSGVLCFLLFECMIALAVLLALAELVSWWAVLALPAAVAVMVKFNDLLAGALSSGGSPRVAGKPSTGEDPEAVVSTQPARAVRQVSRDLTDTLDPVDSPRQQFRQSARRRYE